jgi:signal transduction histidine kinase
LQAIPVDVVTLIESAITLATPQFREKGLSLNLRLDQDAPPVNGDGDAISQIIGQLLTNAYLVSPPDSEITIHAEQRPVKLSWNGSVEPVDCLFVSIEDRGGGIQPEDEARVFSRKYRADNPLIDGLGDTGVGLSVAKALVEAHGGALWMHTRENVGTVFSFALPVSGFPQLEAADES